MSTVTGSQHFNLVHGIRISNDDLVCVGDRVNNKIQVFRPDGTLVKEGYIERKTSSPKGMADTAQASSTTFTASRPIRKVMSIWANRSATRSPLGL